MNKGSIITILFILMFSFQKISLAETQSPYNAYSFDYPPWSGEVKWKRPDKVKKPPVWKKAPDWSKPFAIIKVSVSGHIPAGENKFKLYIETGFQFQTSSGAIGSQSFDCVGHMEETSRSVDGLTIYTKPASNSNCDDGVTKATLTGIDSDKILLKIFKGNREVAAGTVHARNIRHKLNFSDTSNKVSIPPVKPKQSRQWTTKLLGNWRGKFLNENIELAFWLSPTKRHSMGKLQGYVRTVDGKCEYVTYIMRGTIAGGTSGLPSNIKEYGPLHLHYRVTLDTRISEQKELKEINRTCGSRLRELFNVFYDNNSGHVFLQAWANYKPQDGSEYLKPVKLTRTDASPGMLGFIENSRTIILRKYRLTGPSSGSMKLIRNAAESYDNVRTVIPKLACDVNYRYMTSKIRENGIYSIGVKTSHNNAIELLIKYLVKPQDEILEIYPKKQGIEWDRVYFSGNSRGIRINNNLCRHTRAVLNFLAARQAGELKVLTASQVKKLRIQEVREKTRRINEDTKKQREAYEAKRAHLKKKINSPAGYYLVGRNIIAEIIVEKKVKPGVFKVHAPVRKIYGNKLSRSALGDSIIEGYWYSDTQQFYVRSRYWSRGGCTSWSKYNWSTILTPGYFKVRSADRKHVNIFEFSNKSSQKRKSVRICMHRSVRASDCSLLECKRWSDEFSAEDTTYIVKGRANAGEVFSELY